VPQLVVKRSWSTSLGRFQARLVSSPANEGVLCTQSYVTVHVPAERSAELAAACLSYNSILAVYFLLLTSSRFASYRPEPLVSELLRVPVPKPTNNILAGLTSYPEIDRRVRDAFQFKDAEWVLVEDLFNVTLADFKGDEYSVGRLRTRRKVGIGEEPDLRRYCEYFIRVLKAGFGSDKEVAATIFHENGKLPYRLVAFHLNKGASEAIRIHNMDDRELLDELETLNSTWLAQRKAKSGSIYSQRVARIYADVNGTPTIYIVKPDAYRYWTRSMGLHDADEVAADFVRWKSEAHRATTAKG